MRLNLLANPHGLLAKGSFCIDSVGMAHAITATRACPTALSSAGPSIDTESGVFTSTLYFQRDTTVFQSKEVLVATWQRHLMLRCGPFLFLNLFPIFKNFLRIADFDASKDMWVSANQLICDSLGNIFN
jgi:hypothetical protein